MPETKRKYVKKYKNPRIKITRLGLLNTINGQTDEKYGRFIINKSGLAINIKPSQKYNSELNITENKYNKLMGEEGQMYQGLFLPDKLRNGRRNEQWEAIELTFFQYEILK